MYRLPPMTPGVCAPRPLAVCFLLSQYAWQLLMLSARAAPRNHSAVNQVTVCHTYVPPACYVTRGVPPPLGVCPPPQGCPPPLAVSFSPASMHGSCRQPRTVTVQQSTTLQLPK